MQGVDISIHFDTLTEKQKARLNLAVGIHIYIYNCESEREKKKLYSELMIMKGERKKESNDMKTHIKNKQILLKLH